MKKQRIILNPILAKKLLKMGYKIVDLERNKFCSERTVFIFQNEPGLDKIIDEYKQEVNL
jgi:hypothetical protein